MGKFKVKNKQKLSELPIDAELPESDYSTLTPEGTFVQLEYIEDEYVKEPYEVKPGIFSIKKTGNSLKLETTSFNDDQLLGTFVNTKNITDKIDCFFEKMHLYPSLGYDVAKRGMLLYGPPGSGKSSAINIVSKKYSQDGKTAIILWHTDKYEAHTIKDFIKSFEYKGVEKLILIVEDIGGIELEGRRMASDSSLLSLLDNQEKTFTIPVFILATTNYPHNFMGNLVNRRGRFDDKIEVGFPDAKQRLELLKFFTKTPISIEVEKLINSSKTNKFTPADIREIVIRSTIHDKSMEIVIKELIEEIEYYESDFTKQKKMGLSEDY